jgi:hypothetical protein
VQQGAEVCVGRDEHALLFFSLRHHNLVGRALHAEVTDMAGVVVCFAEQVGQDR